MGGMPTCPRGSAHDGPDAAELIGPQPQTRKVHWFGAHQATSLVEDTTVHRRIGLQVLTVGRHDEVQVASNVARFVDVLVLVTEWECGTEKEQQNFEGKLVLKLEGVGSKSEGVRAYLETKDGKYNLYRKGTYEIGDPYFKQFENKNVIVFGELQKGTFIMVEKIEVK